jgi:hypothetical protein
MNAALNYLEVGRWLRACNFATSPRYRTRDQLYAAIAKPLADDRVVFLEFGVFEGVSLRGWSKMLTNPESQLHGFDSFRGLPEAWDAHRPAGTFDHQGRPPTFDDPRVTLHIGWFNETLPKFVLPPHDRLVLNLDADLYSSTKLVLEQLRDQLRPGTILIFDEFCDRLHEMKAFDEFLKETGQKYKFIGATQAFEHVAFERVA